MAFSLLCRFQPFDTDNWCDKEMLSHWFVKVTAATNQHYAHPLTTCNDVVATSKRPCVRAIFCRPSD